jgi:hypothetical protein
LILLPWIRYTFIGAVVVHNDQLSTVGLAFQISQMYLFLMLFANNQVSRLGLAPVISF